MSAVTCKPLQMLAVCQAAPSSDRIAQHLFYLSVSSQTLASSSGRVSHAGACGRGLVGGSHLPVCLPLPSATLCHLHLGRRVTRHLSGLRVHQRSLETESQDRPAESIRPGGRRVTQSHICHVLFRMWPPRDHRGSRQVSHPPRPDHCPGPSGSPTQSPLLQGPPPSARSPAVRPQGSRPALRTPAMTFPLGSGAAARQPGAPTPAPQLSSAT